MMRRLFRIVFVLSVNIFVLAALLAVVEIGFRAVSKQAPGSQGAIQWQQFAPYVMFNNPHNPGGGFRWVDHFHDKKEIVASIVNNQLGFATDEEFNFAKQRPKGDGEKVVIFTGGSAAWGVGATSNAATIAGRMQTILNEGQARYRYTVLNLAMGGWVSFQQYVALSLYGRNLQPDWVVAMDAVNDVAVACAHSQGAGNPMHYALMEAYMKAYTFGQLSPVFYRGWIENELIKYSVAYRRISGKAPVIVDVRMDHLDPGVGRSVIGSTSWEDVERQLELYVQTEGEIIDLFPDAKIILSTQPLPFEFEQMFGQIYRTRGTPAEAAARADLKLQLDSLRDASKGKPCGLALWNDARNWFVPMSALRLEELVSDRQAGGRDAQYANVGTLLPNVMEQRSDFFIDPVHLNDDGMDVIANFYAAAILASDLPDKFERPRWAGETATPKVPLEWIPPDKIRIMEATYGMNCKNFGVPLPAVNRVRLGNVTDVVARHCAGKEGRCDLSIDVERFGDPANSCGKDFSVRWRCGSERASHYAHVEGEAHGKSIRLSCAAN